MVEKHVVETEEDFLDNRLQSKEKYGKINTCGQHLASVYTRVEDYILYKFFQKNDCIQSETGIETN